METRPGQVLKPNIAALDALRGLAATWVLCRHSIYLSQHDGVATLPVNLRNFMLNGWLGVDIFFALSGCVIFFSLRAANSDWRGFYRRRFRRVAPAYVAVIVLCVLGVFPAYQVATDYLGFRLAYHALFLQDYLPSNIVVVLWSLGVEAKFYLLAPLLFVLVEKLRVLRHLLFASALLLLLFYFARHATLTNNEFPETYGAFFSDLRSPFHWCLDSILLGMLAGQYLIRQSARKAVLVFASILAIAGFTASLRSELYEKIEHFDFLEQPAIIVMICTAVLLLVANVPIAWNKYFSALSGLGRISYSFYLVHVPLLPSSLWLAGNIGATSFAGFFCLYFLCTVLVSTLLYVLVERRFYVRTATTTSRVCA